MMGVIAPIMRLRLHVHRKRSHLRTSNPALMPKPMLIHGKEISKILNILLQEKVIIKAELTSGTEQLVVIQRVFKNQGRDYFSFKPDDALAGELVAETPAALVFQYRDSRGVPHVFRTEGVKDTQNLVTAAFPDTIERKQLRRSYRVDAPEGTRVEFFFNTSKRTCRVKDISVGGAFCTIAIEGDLAGKTSDKLMGQLTPNCQIDNITLQTDFSRECGIITLEKAQIVRIARGSDKKHSGFALRFVKLKPEQQKALNRFVLEIERHYLRRRVAVKAGLV